MKRRISKHGFKQQTGYTLIELLLYVAIIGSLLLSVTYFFNQTAEARVKNQSIIEVNDQGQAIMDYLTQIIRNASSITTPAAGATGGTLTLTVPTGTLSPTTFDSGGTILGYNGASSNTDAGDSGAMQATKFTASATGIITTLYGFIGASVSASPNNKGEMAIYNGTSTQPTTLIASSPSTTLLPDSWVAFPLSSSASVTSGQIYWLVYNANGLSSANNDINYLSVGTNQSISNSPTTYDTWPPNSTWNQPAEPIECLMFAPIQIANTPSTIRVTEGSLGTTVLSNNNVEVNGINFTNLTKTGTTGTVRISFTVSRVNPNNHNEFSYSRTFTTTAEIGQ